MSEPADFMPFDLPLGDALIAEDRASLVFTKEMTARFAGGPTQVVSGWLSLTRTQLAFRPPRTQPHPQQVTLPLAHVRRVLVDRTRLLGIPLPGKELLVRALISNRELDLRFRVDDPDAWAARVTDALASAFVPRPPAERLDEALRAGERVRARYVSTLAELSFPQGFWHPEALEDVADVARESFEQLGVPLGRELLARLDLAVPDSGADGENAERLEQIDRILTAANLALGDAAPRRFHAFADDLPGWEDGEPVWLLLSDAQREALLALGILRARD